MNQAYGREQAGHDKALPTETHQQFQSSPPPSLGAEARRLHTWGRELLEEPGLCFSSLPLP